MLHPGVSLLPVRERAHLDPGRAARL